MLLATAPGAGGGPAAALPWEQTTLLGRLLAQLERQGVSELHVVTRPEWAEALDDPAIRLHRSADRAADLRTLADIADDGPGGLVVGNADVLTQDEAFAGLLADPRVPTGILATRRRVSRVMAFGTLSKRGRVVRAGSPYHRVPEQNGTFLGVLKVAAADRPALANVARTLAARLDDALPEAWRHAFDARARTWKQVIHRRDEAGADADTDDGESPDDVDLTPAGAGELERRLAAAEQDVTALLLRGLLAASVPIRNGFLGRLYWARPLAPEDLDLAAQRIGQYDEEEALLKSAVKGNDGFFTTFFVSPYSKYIARWAARRGWSPNAVTTLSMAIGMLAAAAFATGERAGLIAGAVLLQAAFTFDCVDGQLARYTRTFTRLGAWLDSIFDRSKEYAVFAGLAIGSAHAGDDVWLLAGAALALQTVRHTADFSFNIALDQAATRVQRPLARPEEEQRGLRPTLPALDGPGPARWLKKIIAFPIGERFAAISVTAALFDARVTFTILLVWGALAWLYTAVGRVLRSLGAEGATTLPPRSTIGPGPLATLRDDGPLASALGRALGPLLRLPPVLIVGAGALPLLAAAALAGDDASWGAAAAAVGWAVLVCGASSGRLLPRDRLRWTLLPALRAVEYGGLLWIAAIAGAAAVPAAFALLCAIAFRHYDMAYRLRQGRDAPPRWLDLAAGGWDGRLIAALLLAIAGALPAAFYVAAAVLGAAFVTEAVVGWIASAGSSQPPEAEVDAG